MNNMLKSEFVLIFDCRIPLERQNIEDFHTTMVQWCRDISGDIRIDYLAKEQQVPHTQLNDKYWRAIKYEVRGLYVFVP